MPFYVIEPEGEYGPSLPWSLEEGKETSMEYETQKEAEKAAKEYATNSPGCTFYVVQAMSSVVAKVQEPIVSVVEVK